MRIFLFHSFTHNIMKHLLLISLFLISALSSVWAQESHPNPTSSLNLNSSLETASSELNWHFTSDVEGWTPTHHIEGFRWEPYEGGSIGGSLSGNDPYMHSSFGLGLDISNAKYIHIKMKNNSASLKGSVYFITTTNTNYAADKLMAFATIPNSDFTEYIVDMSALSTWTGTLERIRIDPTISVTNGDFNVDFIAINSSASSLIDPDYLDCSEDLVDTTINTMAEQDCGSGNAHISIDNSQIGIQYQVSKDGSVLSAMDGTGETLLIEINSAQLDPGINEFLIEASSNYCDGQIKLFEPLSIQYQPIDYTIFTPVINYDPYKNELSTDMQKGLQWYKDDVAIGGSSDSIIIPDDLSAKYYLTVSNNLCTLASENYPFDKLVICLMADPQLIMVPETPQYVDIAMTDIIDVDHDFMAVLGDLSQNNPDFYVDYKEAVLDRAVRPVYSLAGNADLNAGLSAYMTATALPLYYSIYRRGIRFIFLSTTYFTGVHYHICHLGSEQLSWLEEELNADLTTTTIIFSHPPIFETTWHSEERDHLAAPGSMYLGESAEMRALFSQHENIKIYANGHMHYNYGTVDQYGRDGYFEEGNVLHMSVGASANNCGSSYLFIEKDKIIVKVRDHEHHLWRDEFTYQWDASTTLEDATIFQEMTTTASIVQDCNNGNAQVTINNSEIGILYQIFGDGGILSPKIGTGADLKIEIYSRLLDSGINDFSMQKRSNWGDREFTLLDPLSIYMIYTPEIAYDYAENKLTTDKQDGLQWYKNNVAIEGATDSIINPDDLSAEYFVSVTNSSCSFSSETFIPTSLLSSSLSFGLRVYPNPVEEQFTMETDYFSRISSVELINTAGVVISNIEISKKSTDIDMEYLTAGLYFLKVNDENESLVIKIIKQ